MGSTREEDLHGGIGSDRSANENRRLWTARLTYIENLFVHDLSPAKSPEHCLNATKTIEEIVCANIRILRELMKAFRDQGKMTWVVQFEKYQLNDFIWKETSETGNCLSNDATYHIDAALYKGVRFKLEG